MGCQGLSVAYWEALNHNLAGTGTLSSMLQLSKCLSREFCASPPPLSVPYIISYVCRLALKVKSW